MILQCFFIKNEFKSLAKVNKTYRMASFYKEMRKKYNILVDKEGKPFGERWSFDDENRKKIPSGTEIPQLPKFNLSNHHSEIIELIEKTLKLILALLKIYGFQLEEKMQINNFTDIFKTEIFKFWNLRRRNVRK